MSKDYFYFSKSDRRAAVALLVLIGFLNFARIGLNVKARDSMVVFTDSIGEKAVMENTTEKNYSMPESDLTDRVIYRYPKKLAYGSVVDINTADTTLLKRVPGIGSYYARRITEYRKQLGGYVDVRQLSEIKNLPDSVQNWFVVSDTVAIVKMDINTLSLQELKKHPYINFYQARAITDFVRSHGSFSSVSQLKMLEEFGEGDVRRLLPYLRIE